MSASKPPVTATTYWDYIKVEELLALQSGLETDDEGLANEEVLFVVVHHCVAALQ